MRVGRLVTTISSGAIVKILYDQTPKIHPKNFVVNINQTRIQTWKINGWNLKMNVCKSGKGISGVPKKGDV